MANTICASQGPCNPRLRPELLNKEQVATSERKVNIDVNCTSGSESAQLCAQYQPSELRTLQLSSWLVVLQMVLQWRIFADFFGADSAWRCHAS